MELYHLRSFVTVADEQQLTRAAERLHLSQPAISSHIKMLEEELGVALFVRTPKGMELTREGTLLRSQARKCLAEVNAFVHQAKGLRQSLVGVVRIGVNTYPDTLRVNEFLSLMTADHPQVECHLLQSNSKEIPGLIRDGTLDVGFIYANGSYSDLAVLPLRQTELVIAGPMAWKDRIERADWQAIARFPWIGTFDWCAFHGIMLELFHKHDLQPNIVTVSDGESTLKNLAIGGAGLTLLTAEDAQASEREEKLAIWRRETFPVRLLCMYLPGRENTPILRAVMSCIESAWRVRPRGDSPGEQKRKESDGARCLRL